MHHQSTNSPPPVLLITGASRGIGATTARLAASRGYAVCVNFRTNEHAANNVVEEILEMGGRAIAAKADVANESEVCGLFDRIDSELGTLTALVNNAGILSTQCGILDLDADRVSRILATNVVGTLLCAREAVRRMSTQRGGTGGAIVNVSSIAACTGAPGEYLDYAASKGALDTLTTGLAAEVAHAGIRVNGVRPGFIYTEMHADGGEPDRVDRLAPLIPMKRGGQPEEVARAILWLLSEEASYATGTTLNLAGGRR